MKQSKIITQIIGYCSLIGLAASSIMFLTGNLELAQTKQHILITTIIWFAASGYFMFNNREQANDKNHTTADTIN